MKEDIKGKKVLTNEVIRKTIKSKTITAKLVFGIFCCFVALGGLELFVCGIVFKDIYMMIFGLMICGLFSYLGVINIKSSSKNRSKIQRNSYKVRETLCLGCRKIEEQDNDEGIQIHKYLNEFENGCKVASKQPLGVNGDVFYLVYLDGSHYPNAIFNAADYILSDELKIENDF